MSEYRPVLRPVPRFEPSARRHPNEPDRGGSGSEVGGAVGSRAETEGGGTTRATPPRERAHSQPTCGNAVVSKGRRGGGSVTAVCSSGVPRGRRRSRMGAVSGHGVPEGVRQVLRAGHTAAMAEAREYSWRVLRMVLEVLDRRRPVAQLARFASPAVQAAVGTLVGGNHLRHRELGTAVLARVHVIGGDDGAIEVCGTYQRGSRHFAIAARITRAPATGWQLTALRV